MKMMMMNSIDSLLMDKMYNNSTDIDRLEDDSIVVDVEQPFVSMSVQQVMKESDVMNASVMDVDCNEWYSIHVDALDIAVAVEVVRVVLM